MLDELKDQPITTVVRLDAYEAERPQQDNEFDEEETCWCGCSGTMQESQQGAEGSTQQPSSERQEHPTSVNTDEEEPNLYDILEEDVSDINEEDPLKDEPEDVTGDEDLEG